jgi:hypothetical protein
VYHQPRQAITAANSYRTSLFEVVLVLPAARLDEFPDLVHDAHRVIRLYKEWHIMGATKLIRCCGPCGVTRCQDDGKARTVLPHPTRQVDPIQLARQTNVTEYEINPGSRRLKNIDSLSDGGSAKHIEPALLQVVASHKAGQLVVFDDKDS